MIDTRIALSCGEDASSENGYCMGKLVCILALNAMLWGVAFVLYWMTTA